MTNKLNLHSTATQIEIAKKEQEIAVQNFLAAKRALHGRNQILKSLEALQVLETEGNKK